MNGAVALALGGGHETAAVQLAMRFGLRHESRLTDLVFHARHPERQGRRLDPSERPLVREWHQIRADIVRPLLRGATPLPAAAPPVAASGFVPRPMEVPGGGRIKDKREPNPADLVEVQGVDRVVQLHRIPAQAFGELIRAARADWIAAPLLLPTSGYRSVARQRQLWEQALRKYGSPQAARKWVAPPGGSPHQTGRTVDLYLGGRNSSSNTEALRKLPAHKWMVANAEAFGFYPYEAEPWHWEYNPPAAHPELEEEAWRSKAERKKTPKEAVAAHVNARIAFERVRDAIARKLNAQKGQDLHHKIELQVLKGFPGVFTPDELNRADNLVPLAAPFHRSWIRLFWNKRYRMLDEAVKKAGLKPGTPAYNDYVRRRIGVWRRVADGAVRRFQQGRTLPPVLVSEAELGQEAAPFPPA
jgi:D-alanyl-D-alanine dipeptidase